MALQFNGFNKRLEELIEYTGMTHKEVATKSGVSKRVIDSYTSTSVQLTDSRTI